MFFQEDLVKKNKSIALIGLGVSNLGVLETLMRAGTSNITVREKRDIPLPEKYSKKVRLITGEDYLRELDEDVILLSPTVRPDRPELQRARSHGALISSDTDLFFRHSRGKQFAVTGSDGKSTTVTLAERLLRSGGKFSRVRAGGNIGNALTPYLLDEGSGEAYVSELSSFQLSLGAPITDRSVVTNLTPNHLDWHKSFEEYVYAKLSLLKSTKEPILNLDDPILRAHLCEINPYAVYTSKDTVCVSSSASAELTVRDGYLLKNGRRLLSLSSVPRGVRLTENLLAAVALTDGYADEGDVFEIATRYTPLPHRCELVGTFRGATYYDSSIDSTPSRTIATLSAFSSPVILLLGGRSKGVSYRVLREEMEKRVRAALVFGENREEILTALSGISVPLFPVKSLEEGIRLAAQLSHEGDAVLLSPASTSFDKYTNYAARGEHFSSLVRELGK